MNTKKILGVVAVLALVAVAMVGAGAATDSSVILNEGVYQITVGDTDISEAVYGVTIDVTDTTPYTVNSIVINAENGATYKFMNGFTLSPVDTVGAIKGGIITLNGGSNSTDSYIDFEDAPVTRTDTSATYDVYENSALVITGSHVYVKNINLTVSGTYTGTGLCQGRLVCISNAADATVYNAKFNFNGLVCNLDTALIGVMISGVSGTTTIANSEITNGDSTGYASQAVSVFACQNGSILRFENSTITSGASATTQPSSCIRYNAEYPLPALQLENVTLNATDGTLNIGIHGKTYSGNQTIGIDTVTFNVNGDAFNLKDYTGTNTVTFTGTNSFVGNTCNVALEGTTQAIVMNGLGSGIAVSGPEAKIGNTYYATLVGAISAATSGNTVELLKDVTLTSDMTIPANVVLVVPAGMKLSTTGDTVKLNVSGELTVKGSFEGKIGSVSGNTIIIESGGNVIAEFDSLSSIAAKSIVLNSTAVMTVPNDVTLEDINTKLKTVDAGAVVIRQASTTAAGEKEVFNSYVDVSSSGSITKDNANVTTVQPHSGTSIVGYEKVVTYEFTIPSAITLGDTGTTVTYDYKIKVKDNGAATDLRKVTMVLKSAANGYDSENELYKAVNLAASGEYYNYTIKKDSSTGNIIGLGDTVVEVNISSTTETPQTVAYTTCASSDGAHAGNYQDTLTFDLSIQNGTVSA